ncbi:uncharacterized protein [Leptinotarsa decemlineata]|uniref:uncharacterized protein n=1 Tax=Leptinotarsa decemlineata TaxID=7539 RepID=UPI003D304D58
MNTDDAEYILSHMRGFPQFQISKEDILRPTPEIVFRFYSKFISEFHERATFIAGTSLNLLDTDSESGDPEERLFQKMSQMSTLFEKAGMKFLHGDIYEPTVVRTKNLFKICIHFLSFVEQILEETERLGSDICKKKGDSVRMEEDHQNLMSNINEAATKKAELLESVNKLNDDLKCITSLQEEYMELKAKKDKSNDDKRKQIEMMKRELQKEEYDFERLELQEKKFIEQTITESEHKTLLQMLDNLENEIKSLSNDDVNMADILLHENSILEHYQACIKRLPDVSEFNVEVVKNFITNEELLNDLEVNTEKLHDTKLTTVSQSKFQKDKLLKETEYLLSKRQVEYESCKMVFLKNIEELLLQVKQFKEELEAKYQKSIKSISSYMNNIEKLKSDLEKIRNSFCDEYIKFCKAEKSATDMFTKHLQILQTLDEGGKSIDSVEEL